MLTPDQKKDLNRAATGRHISKERLEEFQRMGLIFTDTYNTVRFTHDGTQALHHINTQAHP